MAKVRWSTWCAGGCGEFLHSGNFAMHARGNWWCTSCYIEHRSILEDVKDECVLRR